MPSKTVSKRGGARPGSGRKKQLEDKQTISVVLDADDLALLDAVASAREVTRSAVVRDLVRGHLQPPS